VPRPRYEVLQTLTANHSQFQITTKLQVKETSGQRILPKGRIACCPFVPLLRIQWSLRCVPLLTMDPFCCVHRSWCHYWFFAAVYAAVTYNMFVNGPENRQNCPFPRRDLNPHLKHDSLDPRKSVSNKNGISIGTAAFAGLTNVTNRRTDTQTTLLRLYSNRPHLMHW